MFQNPQFIYTLPVVFTLLVLLYVNSRRKRKQRVSQLTHIQKENSPHRNHCMIRSRLKVTFTILGLLFLMLSLARPQFGFEWKDQRKHERNMLIVLDVSRSMLVEDVYPNRLERSKLIIQEIIEAEPQTNIGLLIFAGTAFLQCPITEDHIALLECLKEQAPELIHGQGSDFSKVLFMLPEMIQSPLQDSIILVSDGEDHSQRLNAAVQYLENKQLKLHTICVGTEKGGLIPNHNSKDASEPYFYDAQGNVIYSKATPFKLQTLANKLGGCFVHFNSENYSMRKLHQMLNQSTPAIKKDIKKKKTPVEYYQGPLILAFILLVLDMAMGTRKPDSALKKSE